MSKAIILGFHTHMFNDQDNYPDRGWYMFTNRIVGPYIVAEKFRNHGIETEVIDFLPFWSDDEIRQFFELQNDIKYIGVNCTLPPLDHVKKYIDIAKEYFPDAIYIAGGQQSFKAMDIECDYYISGFAETAIDAVLNHELYNTDLEFTVLYSGKLVNTISGTYETHKLPDYQTYYHETDHIDKNDVLVLEIGRGCKFSCSFCNFSLIGLKDRTIRNSNDIRQELIRNYELYGVTNYVLGDDTTNESIERLQTLADAVNGLEFKPTFGGFVRLDLITAHPEQMELMAKARLIYHYYGVETFNQHTGKHIGKGLSSDKLKETLLKTREYIINEVGDYHGDIGLIIGLPFESKESIQSSYEWTKDNWCGKGQSVTWFPLQIPTQDISKSKIGMDLSKYGYTTIPETEIKDNLLKIGKASVGGSIFWANDHINVADAMDLMYKYRIPWESNDRSLSFVESLIIKARLDNDTDNVVDKYMKVSHEHFKKYKNKKLKKC